MESDSDNEAPDVVSTQKAKSEREQEIMGIFMQKRKIRDEQKLKRKAKADKLAVQKKEKEMRQKKIKQDLDEEGGTIVHDEDDINNTKSAIELEPRSIADNEGNAPNSLSENDNNSRSNSERPKEISRKFYPKYNVAVDSLDKISNPRATSALNFKERRLAKVHRENVASTVVSYNEKMLVKNT